MFSLNPSTAGYRQINLLRVIMCGQGVLCGWTSPHIRDYITDDSQISPRLGQLECEHYHGLHLGLGPSQFHFIWFEGFKGSMGTWNFGYSDTQRKGLRRNATPEKKSDNWFKRDISQMDDEIEWIIHRQLHRQIGDVPKRMVELYADRVFWPDTSLDKRFYHLITVR